MTPLERVSNARRRRHAAKTSYVAAIRSALEAGESKSAVARAAGVSRPTLYKLLADHTTEAA